MTDFETQLNELLERTKNIKSPINASFGETNINEYYLSVFVRGDDGRYDKYEEEHFQRGYTLQEVRQAVEMSGLKIENIYEAFSDNEGYEENDRVYVVARKTSETK